MEKNIELLKKLKALSEKGVGGEATNATDMLNKLLKKHNLTLEDLEEDKKNDYYFSTSGMHSELLHQIAKMVNSEVKCYDVPLKMVKKHKLSGNFILNCTSAEFIEIDQMFSVYKNLLDKELKVFYYAFLQTNDLLITPKKGSEKKLSDLSKEEKEQLLRANEMASLIKKETVRKQISNSNS
jgi:hypothetical protein